MAAVKTCVRPLLAVFGVLPLLGVLAGACGGSQKSGAASGASNKPQLSIVLTSTKDTNQGRPLHVLVRAVDLQSYVQDTYSAIASKVVQPDDSVLGAGVVYPGHDTVLHVTPPDKGSVAVYFLFTRPDASWKMRIESPSPGTKKVALGDRGVAQSSPHQPAPESGGGELPTRRKIALGSGAVGAAALVTGSVFGILAERRWSSATAYCNASYECSSQGITLGDEARSLGRVANISFAVSATAIAAGAALWFLTPASPGAPSDKSAASLEPALGPGHGGVLVRVRF